MQRSRIIAAAALLVALGTSAIAYAQARGRDERGSRTGRRSGETGSRSGESGRRSGESGRRSYDSSRRRGTSGDRTDGRRRTDGNRSTGDRRRLPDTGRGAHTDRGPRRDHDGPGGPERDELRRIWTRRRARSFDFEHRSWRQRGGYHGYRIPDSLFRTHFGRSHWFRIYDLPYLVVGLYPRFQYGGYWFEMVDPYPEYWDDDWYYYDDVYVDYIDDGYYLFNRRFPNRPGISIRIFL